MKDLLLLATAIGQLGTQADIIGRSTGASRVPAFLGAFPILLPLAKVDFKAARDQLKAATDEQRAEVEKALAGAFDLKNDQLERVIEHGITFIESAYSSIQSGIELIGLIKEMKADKEVVNDEVPQVQ